MKGEKKQDLLVILGKHEWKDIFSSKHSFSTVFWGHCVSSLTQASADSAVMVNYSYMIQSLTYIIDRSGMRLFPFSPKRIIVDNLLIFLRSL